MHSDHRTKRVHTHTRHGVFPFRLSCKFQVKIYEKVLRRNGNRVNKGIWQLETWQLQINKWIYNDVFVLNIIFSCRKIVKIRVDLMIKLQQFPLFPVTLPFQRFQTLEIEKATTSKFCNPHGFQTTSATHKADVPLTVWTLCHGQNVDQFRPSYYGSIFIMFTSSPSVPKTFDLANQCYSWFLTP